MLSGIDANRLWAMFPGPLGPKPSSVSRHPAYLRVEGRELSARLCYVHLPTKVDDEVLNLNKHRSALRVRAAPPGALAHSPSQMPLSCPVAPPSQREMHKDGGGGGGGVAMSARAARAPKPKSCAASCGKPSATPSAAFCVASLACSSFTCRLGKAWGAVEHGACHDKTPLRFRPPRHRRAGAPHARLICGPR